MPKKAIFLISCLLALPLVAQAENTSKILATPGLSSLDGAAGGGIVPWAVIGGYGSEGEWGAAASISAVHTDDFDLSAANLLVGINNRVELSYAQQTLQVNSLASAFSAPYDSVIEQQMYGVKVRAFGDLIYGAAPQVSVGAIYKVNLNPDVGVDVLGADRDRAPEFYVSATKLWLHALFERNVLLNVTARYTDANQTGFLGFGNAEGSAYELVGEASAAILLNPRWAIGAEYKQQPDRLATVDESPWWDAFVAWFPNNRVSMALAYADLGTVALWPEQNGVYLTIQISN